MRKLLTLSAVAMLTVGVGSAAAITGGEPDNGRHPQVGLVVFYDATGAPIHRCSGTLLAAKLFLTAGHCTFGMASAQVWFDDEVTTASGYPFTGGVEGTPYTHPEFEFVLPNTSDVGVVVLSKAVRGVTYATLAPLGYLDTLATRKGTQDLSVTNVGYGLQEVVPNLQADRVRYLSRSKIVDLRSALTDGFNVHTKADAGGGNDTGGTCFGDSGGPVFANDTLSIVGITSFGLNENCTGAAYAYRADIENTQDFVSQFLG
jgi:V8-like Glu-specific endopeptidase